MKKAYYKLALTLHRDRNEGVDTTAGYRGQAAVI
ncbi:hypothetical protein J2N86_08925 [Legionella lytica]|uniref:J domain-containing protein n=1 Tax=Legionella lytica TaxID=96232 RepID=A0ABY4YBZ9_9GAMM|nr:hypothetical protein J2N86_08925 [Legionella lytica]